jgi:hypothetical protein
VTLLSFTTGSEVDEPVASKAGAPTAPTTSKAAAPAAPAPAAARMQGPQNAFSLLMTSREKVPAKPALAGTKRARAFDTPSRRTPALTDAQKRLLEAIPVRKSTRENYDAIREQGAKLSVYIRQLFVKPFVCVHSLELISIASSGAGDGKTEQESHSTTRAVAWIY